MSPDMEAVNNTSALAWDVLMWIQLLFCLSFHFFRMCGRLFVLLEVLSQDRRPTHTKNPFVAVFFFWLHLLLDWIRKSQYLRGGIIQPPSLQWIIPLSTFSYSFFPHFPKVISIFWHAKLLSPAKTIILFLLFLLTANSPQNGYEAAPGLGEPACVSSAFEVSANSSRRRCPPTRTSVFVGGEGNAQATKLPVCHPSPKDVKVNRKARCMP